MSGSEQIDYLARAVLESIRRNMAMMNCKRTISKEQYEKAEQGEWDAIFTDAEWMGYGIYGPTLHKESDENGQEVYSVTYSMGSSCD